MSLIALLVLFVLGRATSLGLYRMCWANGVAGNFIIGSAVATLLCRPLPWLVHLAVVWPVASLSWQEAPLLQATACMLAALLALGAVGRLGSADLGRFFMGDRLLVIALLAGVWFSPALVYPCLIACGCLQYTVASWRLGPGYSNLLGFEFIRASLSLVAAALALRGWLEIAGVPWSGFEGAAIAALIALQASTYLNHALAKSALGPKWHSWIRENRIECLAANAWLRGWTIRRSQAAMLKQARRIASHRRLICGTVWLLEFSWWFILADPRLALVILSATALFHLIVFALTGLAAYQYLINHLFLIGLILANDLSSVFTTPHLAACLIALAAAAVWVGWLRMRVFSGYQRGGSPGRMASFADAADHLMAWWDTPLMRMFSYTVETRSGRRFSLPVPRLSPHDTALTDIHTHLMILGLHGDLDPAISRDRAIARTGVWGLTIHRDDRDFLCRLMDDPASDVQSSLSPPGGPPAWNDADTDSAQALRRLFSGINRMRFRAILRWPHIPGEDLAPDICPLVTPILPRFRFDEPVATVTLWRIKTFLHGDALLLIEHQPIGHLPIERSPP